MKSKSLFALAGASAIVVCAQVASAHPGHGAGSGVAAGVTHPFTGIDHVLAMIAVGLVAAQIGGRALWILPGLFLASMLAGGLFAVGHAPVPMVEQGIAASVLVLGLVIATGSRLGMPVIGAMVALFALFHGYAHGAEMRAGMSPIAYATGFALATAFLHLVGIGLGVALRRAGRMQALRIAGAAVALMGVMLFVA